MDSRGVPEGGPTPIQIEETAILVHLVPADALRDPVYRAVGNINFAETFRPVVRKVRRWAAKKGRLPLAPYQ